MAVSYSFADASAALLGDKAAQVKTLGALSFLQTKAKAALGDKAAELGARVGTVTGTEVIDRFRTGAAQVNGTRQDELASEILRSPAGTAFKTLSVAVLIAAALYIIYRALK